MESDRNAELYIPLQGKHTTNTEETPFDLAEKIKQFFVFDETNSSDPRVMLLMGDTGSGKSIFAQQLFLQLRQQRKNEDPMPVWIPLPELLNPFEGAVEEVLKKQEFTESQIAQMKAKERFIFIVDGYDELHQFQNCYMTNKWNQWQVKVLITCRSQALYYQKDPDKYFVPFNGEKRISWLLRKLYVAPFSQDQITAYVEQYNRLNYQTRELAQDKTAVLVEDFDKIPGLKDLITTPFLLHLTVQALPDILAEQKMEKVNQKMTQAKLYDAFIERWFVRQIKKLQTAGQLKDDPKKTKQQFWDYCKRLAQQMHAKEVSVIPYIQEKVGGRLFGKQLTNIWESFFSEGTEVLRSACPLKKMGDHHYGFIHASFVEYFATRAMYEELQAVEEADKLEGVKEVIDLPEDMPSKNNALRGGIYQRLFSLERQAIQFLADRIEMKALFKQKMLTIVEHSKTDERYAIGAANAMTALVKARLTFNCADLAGIRIAGANLSGGYFACVNLACSDLRDVVLGHAYLVEANLRGCRLQGIQFQEYPWFKQNSQVKNMDYRFDLKRLVTADDENINLWDTETGHCIKVLSGHERAVNSVQFSGDGRQVVSGSRDKTVRVWDVTSGEAKVLRGHEHVVRCVASSGDGRQVVSGSYDKTVRVWDVVSGEAKVLRGHEHVVWCVAFSGDGRQVVSGSYDKTVRVWDVVSGEGKVLRGHEGYVQSVEFSGDGRQVVSGSEDKTVRVWDVTSGEAKVLRGHESGVQSAQFSGDGRQVVSGSEDKTVRVWDMVSGGAKVLRGHEGRVQSVAFSSDGRQVVSGSEDKTVRVWDVTSGEAKVLRGHEFDVWCVAFIGDGRQVVSGSMDRTVRVWDVAGGEGKALRGHESSVQSVQFIEDGRQVASGSMDQTVRVWDVVSGEVEVLRGYAIVSCVAFSGDGRQVVSGSWDKTAPLWNVVSGEAKVLRGHEGRVQSVAFSRDGRQVASGSEDKTVRVWDVVSGEVKVLRGYESEVFSVQFSRDGRQVVSGSEDKTVRVWDVLSGEVKVLCGHEKGVKSVAFSRDGRQVVSGSADHTVRVWDMVRGETKVLRGHEEAVSCVAFSGDGWQVVSGSWDNTVRMWDIERKEALRCITFFAPVRNFSLHEEKGLLCIGLEDGTVQCWQRTNASWESLRLQWGSSHPNDVLLLSGCDTRGSEGLSQLNRRLLEQRGAIVDPAKPVKGQWLDVKQGVSSPALQSKLQQGRVLHKDHGLMMGVSRSPRTSRESERSVEAVEEKKPSDQLPKKNDEQSSVKSPVQKPKRTPFQFLTRRKKGEDKGGAKTKDQGNSYSK